MLNYPGSMIGGVSLISYTSDFFFYKFGISLKRSCISIRLCKENANIRILYDFLLAKIAGSSKILLLPSGTHGVMLIRHNYLSIFTSHF